MLIQLLLNIYALAVSKYKRYFVSITNVSVVHIMASLHRVFSVKIQDFLQMTSKRQFLSLKFTHYQAFVDPSGLLSKKRSSLIIYAHCFNICARICDKNKIRSLRWRVIETGLKSLKVVNSTTFALFGKKFPVFEHISSLETALHF